MFAVSDRERVRDYVLHVAENDERVVAGAVVGSLALREGDRWSDLDLTFGVADEFSMFDVLEDWTIQIRKEFDATPLFDLPAGESIYRVFLVPDCLQFDLSFTPASKFGPTGPKFKLLFGKAIDKPYVQPQSAEDLFGYAVHHAIRARFCIERGKFWQAEYWIHGLRDCALNIACRKRNLPANNGRGYDQLPDEARDLFDNGLVMSIERDELLRALKVNVNGLLRETDEVKETARKVEPQLQELTMEWRKPIT